MSDKSTILLIDDDASLLITLKDFFEFEGYQVVTAESGEQGLERLETMEPDLIILDMSMPGMGGVGFLKEISDAEGKPAHPVLVLTARANMAEFFADVDVDGFVAKPCDPQDLLMEVGRIIFLRRGMPQQQAETAVATKQRSKILLGDDDEKSRDALVGALAEAGYIAQGLEKGPEILENAIVQQPDVIVMKLVLSGMNGDAVANMLKELPTTRDIPVVLFDDTASGFPESRFARSDAEKCKFVRSADADAIVQAVAEMLADA